MPITGGCLSKAVVLFAFRDSKISIFLKLKGNPLSQMVCHKQAGHRSRSWERTKEGAGVGERRPHPTLAPQLGAPEVAVDSVALHSFAQALDLSVPELPFLR